MKNRGLAIAAFLLLFVLVVYFAMRDERKKSVATEPSATTSASAIANAAASREHEERIIVPPSEAAAMTSVFAKWGSGRGELGHSLPREGNPEGPMSFTPTRDGLVVLDQVNGRLVRYDKRGNVIGTQSIGPTVQDVAVAKDGTTALLDRLGEKDVTLTNASGQKIGSLALPQTDPGNVTGVFVDGNTVYVEEGHGGLVGIGTTDGQPLGAPVTLGGRPTKDGALLVTGTLAPAEGKLTVNAIDRATGTMRFARLIQMPRPSNVIVLLDSDNRGVVYAGVAAGDPESATIACLDPSDGHVLGRVAMAMSADPEETFRDFAVDGDGTITDALRDSSGVTYLTATCP